MDCGNSQSSRTGLYSAQRRFHQLQPATAMIFGGSPPHDDGECQ